MRSFEHHLSETCRCAMFLTGFQSEVQAEGEPGYLFGKQRSLSDGASSGPAGVEWQHAVTLRFFSAG